MTVEVIDAIGKWLLIFLIVGFGGRWFMRNLDNS